MSDKSDYYDSLFCNEWSQEAEFGPSALTRYRLLIALLKKYAEVNNTLLDCGCGAGVLIEKLRKKGYKVSGSDFSREAISICEKKGSYEVFIADLTDISTYNGNTYDVVICSEVLEHIEDDDLAIKNLFKLVNPGGLLICSVPYLMQYWSREDESVGHLRRYEPGELNLKLEKSGFTILSSFGWGTFLFAAYHNMLMKSDLKKKVGHEKTRIKAVVSKCLYYFFF